jgi:hypothetical protein
MCSIDGSALQLLILSGQSAPTEMFCHVQILMVAKEHSVTVILTVTNLGR